MIKITNVYSSESYDYPVQVQESLAELSTTIGAAFSNLASHMSPQPTRGHPCNMTQEEFRAQVRSLVVSTDDDGSDHNYAAWHHIARAMASSLTRKPHQRGRHASLPHCHPLTSHLVLRSKNEAHYDLHGNPLSLMQAILSLLSYPDSFFPQIRHANSSGATLQRSNYYLSPLVAL
ncbi:hypothetical protein BDZ89DRAFT_699616 [Hymenopellis radicata]|nr:hypothetical protein BDZ89DRAFT_699616 [Hymenopellis radicata]